ncbi:hypothetical protein PMAYCL1PPCAC_25075, partial [Pristionchus mayeri]
NTSQELSRIWRSSRRPKMLRVSLSLLALVVSTFATPDCALRAYDEGTVCVCNATHCDDIEPLGSIPLGNAVIYRTDANGANMDRTVQKQKPQADGLVVELDPSTQYQAMIGFGGCFVDAVGINLVSLSEPAQEKLMRAYFGPSGTEYSIGRVPIASTDFS